MNQDTNTPNSKKISPSSFALNFLAGFVGFLVIAGALFVYVVTKGLSFGG